MFQYLSKCDRVLFMFQYLSKCDRVLFMFQYLSKCDRVLFMRDGMVTDSGTHTELMKADTEYSALIKVFYTQEKKKEESLDDVAGME